MNQTEQYLFDIVYQAWVAFCTKKDLPFENAMDYCRTQTKPPITIGSPGREAFQKAQAEVGRKRYIEIGRKAIEKGKNEGHK